MKVLIVDDEKQLTDAVAAVLLKNKIDVDAVHNGEDGFYYAMTGLYDVIVLDIMLPKLSGYQVLEKLRQEGVSTPVIFLSAKSTTDDKIVGLNRGADDYLTKPFDMLELIARIKALSRRKQEYVGDELKFGDIVLSRNSYELKCGGKGMRLGSKEFAILELLILSKGTIISKDTFIEKIWGYDGDTEYNNVEVYVSFVRKKLAALGSQVTIRAHRNIGYILDGEK